MTLAGVCFHAELWPQHILAPCMQDAGGGRWGLKGSADSPEWGVLGHWSQVPPTIMPSLAKLPRQREGEVSLAWRLL